MEGLTTALALVALLYAAEQPLVAALLLSAATWLKVWPAAVVLPLLIACTKQVHIFLPGVAVSTAVVGFAWAADTGEHLLDFAINQRERGMQLEATFSTPRVWLSVLGMGGSRIADNVASISSEVHGSGVEIAAQLTGIAITPFV